MKGGGQSGSSGSNCKTLPNAGQSPMMGPGGGGGPGQPGGMPNIPPQHTSLKYPKDQAPIGDPISSAVVKYNYQAQQLDELSLAKGAKILILEKSGDGWWRGQYGNKVGWFPSNYTQEELEDAHTYCMAENVLDIMVALYAFKVQLLFSLKFKIKGHAILQVGRPPNRILAVLDHGIGQNQVLQLHWRHPGGGVLRS